MSTDVHLNPLSLYQRSLQSVLMRVRPAPLAVVLKKILGTGRTVVSTPSGKFWIDPVSLLGMALSNAGRDRTPSRETLETACLPRRQSVCGAIDRADAADTLDDLSWRTTCLALAGAWAAGHSITARSVQGVLGVLMVAVG